MSKLINKFGPGSFSILLFLIGLFFSISLKNNLCFGDIILNNLGLQPWSSTSVKIHYTLFYSLVFFIPSIIIGHKFKYNLGATSGKILSSMVVFIILITSFFILL